MYFYCNSRLFICVQYLLKQHYIQISQTNIFKNKYLLTNNNYSQNQIINQSTRQCDKWKYLLTLFPKGNGQACYNISTCTHYGN